MTDHFRKKIKDDEVDLYGLDRLATLFGPVVAAPGSNAPAVVGRDLVGGTYREMLAEMTAIVVHQWRNAIRRSSIKGFLLHGGVGVGKTSMAMRVAYELALAFQGRSADDGADGEVALVLIDSSDIARGRYGDTEDRIRAVFDHAQHGPFVPSLGLPMPLRRTVLLFDDVETLFMSRTADRSKEWHFSQNAVFFHQLDALDTSRAAVFLTTNRLELLDPAIVDRFLTVEFPRPTPEVLAHIALVRGSDQQMSADDLGDVLREIESGRVSSVREVERLVQRRYVERIVRERDSTGSRATVADG